MDNITLLREEEFKKREKRLEFATPQKLDYCKASKTKLKITYVMTWTGVCGGTKIILEHANKLVAMGHDVTLISHDIKPEWFNLDNKVEFIRVPWEKVLCESIPKCDLIVATYWREIYECVEQKIAPVVYFEQGDFHLFDLEKLSERQFKYIKKQLETVKFVYTVSNFAKKKLKEIYNKDSIVIPNAVNENVFYFEPHKENSKITITLIGSEDAKFKNINNILNALNIIREKGYEIDIKWITPTKPKNNDIEAIINPKQQIIGETLRKSDIYICASNYESFCLPVLEAMTCGTAVITTNNGGNMDFVINMANAVLIEKNNVNDIVNKAIELIEDKELRNKIAHNGMIKSKEYSWERTMKEIVEYYKEIAKYRVCE